MVYEGKEKYIFVSYAHKDTKQVVATIKALQMNGYRVWYDKGIEAGTEWPEYIAEHLEACECFIAFMSKNALDSNNCRQEINRACDLNKKLLVIYLEDVELTPGMRLRLSSTQAMFKFRLGSDEEFYEQLCKARIFADCKEPQPPKVEETDSKDVFIHDGSSEEAAKKEIKKEPEKIEQSFQKKIKEIIEFDDEDDDGDLNDKSDVKLSPKAKTLNSFIIILELLAIPLYAVVVRFATTNDFSFWQIIGLAVAPRVLVSLINLISVNVMKKNLTKEEFEEIEGAQYGMAVLSVCLAAIISIFTVRTPGSVFTHILVALGLGIASSIATFIVWLINIMVNSSED